MAYASSVYMIFCICDKLIRLPARYFSVFNTIWTIFSVYNLLQHVNSNLSAVVLNIFNLLRHTRDACIEFIAW